MEMIEPHEEQKPKEVMDLKATVPAVLRAAQAWVEKIKDKTTIDQALAWCQDRKVEIDSVVTRLATGKRLARAAYEEWLSLERDATKPREEAIRQVKARVGAVHMQLQAKAKAEQESALAAARKEAEQKAQKEAAKLEKKGEPEMAKAVLSAASSFVPPIIEAPKAENGNIRPVWRVRLKGNTEQERRQSLLKFVNFLANRPDLMHLVQLNVKELEREAERHEAECPYHGLEFYPEARVSLAPMRRSA